MTTWGADGGEGGIQAGSRAESQSVFWSSWQSEGACLLATSAGCSCSCPKVFLSLPASPRLFFSLPAWPPRPAATSCECHPVCYGQAAGVLTPAGAPLIDQRWEETGRGISGVLGACRLAHGLAGQTVCIQISYSGFKCPPTKPHQSPH